MWAFDTYEDNHAIIWLHSELIGKFCPGVGGAFGNFGRASLCVLLHIAQAFCGQIRNKAWTMRS